MLQKRLLFINTSKPEGNWFIKQLLETFELYRIGIRVWVSDRPYLIIMIG